MHTLNKTAVQLTIGLSLLLLLTGCPEWNSHPVVAQQHFGLAYKNMVKHQTLYPEHGRNDKPVLGMDGRKAESVINAYRQPAQEKLDESKKPVTIEIDSGGN